MGFDLTGLGAVAEFAKDLVDRFLPATMSDAEKEAVSIKMSELIASRESALLDTQKSVIVEEMKQGDNFTKRARPMIVYAGLSFIFLIHVAFPIAAYFFNKPMPSISLPDAFWTTWGGVCGIWVIGRSAEKYGARNNIVKKIIG